MVAVKAGDVERVLANPDPSVAVFLIYGPDTGLVSERAQRTAARAVAGSDDPFQLVRLEGDDLASDPLRLADEANTIGLFGGKRAIRVSATSRNIVPALTPVLSTPPQDAIIIVEAGDLQRSSPLRTLCERSPVAVALPCYPDAARDIGTLIDEIMRENGLSIDREARTMLIGLLGGDRAASRNEIHKLALYAHGKGTVTPDDVEAVVGDVSAMAIDAVVDSAFSGDLPELDHSFSRLMSEGFDAGVLLGFAMRHGLSLAQARIGMESSGESASSATAGMRGLHFKRKAAVEKHLRLWTAADLAKAGANLTMATATVRRNAGLGSEIALKALWSVAVAARRAARN